MKCHACTLFKDTRFGAPGIRATKDPAIVAAAKREHDIHLEVRYLLGHGYGSFRDNICLLYTSPSPRD